MRNIPVFTGEFGAATLILQEIPGRGEAYCVVQWVQPGKTWEFLAECARFCRMAGARRVLASHLPEPPAAPPQVRLLRMACLRSGVPETDAALWPLLPENGEECPCTRGICPGFWTRGVDILSTGMERFWELAR